MAVSIPATPGVASPPHPLAEVGGDDEAAPILIVDDLADKHLVFRSVLEELGEPIVGVRSGREALAQLLARRFAVILLDVNMPGIDGLETAQLVRGHPRSAHTPILFVSAHMDDMQARRGYALGAVDYIPSPVVPQVLRSKVKVFVDLYRMERQLRRHAEERAAMARAQEARRAAEEAMDRADYLSRASDVLSRSLDPGLTRAALLSLSVPELAASAELVDSADAAHAWPAPQREAALALQEAGAAAEWADAARAAAVLPLRASGRLVGLLRLQDQPGHFEPPRLALAREVAGRAAIAIDNARLYTAVREADRRKNEFLAMLAHELRNPLAPIRNAAHILRAPALKPQTLAWARAVIDRQAQHMTRLIDDLLDVSRIVQGKVTVRLQPLWLSDLLESCVEATAPRLQARGQALRVSAPPQRALLQGDPVRLAQVLSNLVNNASKFSPPGAPIDLEGRLEEGAVVVVVRDRGCGIAPAFLPHIFDLFVQGEQPLDRSQGGLGVGLTLVRHLVALHGGEVEARSGGPGQGCEMVVRLPVCSPAAHEAVPPPTAAQADGARRPSRRVLVVDDMAASAETLTLLLEMEGHQVRVAHEGEAALALANEFAPEVVLLDIGLPGLSGFEVATRLRAHEATRHSLLVALTGYGEAESRVRSARAGFDLHMVKPADVDRLLELLQDPTSVRQF